MEVGWNLLNFEGAHETSPLQIQDMHSMRPPRGGIQGQEGNAVVIPTHACDRLTGSIDPAGFNEHPQRPGWPLRDTFQKT